MTRHRRVKEPASGKVRRVKVASAELIELGADHSAWVPGSPEDLDNAPEHNCPGAIVKLVPAPGTAESLVLAVERAYYSGGAASVKVMPTQEEVQVTVEGETFDFTEHNDERPLRQVVMERAARVTSSHDQAALEALLTRAMDHAEAT